MAYAQFTSASKHINEITVVTELIGNAALWPAEQLINRLIGSDQHLLSLLKKFAGKAIQVQVLQPDFAAQLPTSISPLPSTFPIRIGFDAREIHLAAIDSIEYSLAVDAQVSASASTFSRLLLEDHSRRSLVSENLKIEGDTELVQDIFTAMNQLDVEWEDVLPPMLGDVVTHQFSQFLANANGWLAQNRTRMLQNVDDYLKEEIQVFPTAIEVENFKSSLDALRLRIDRAEAQVANLVPRDQKANPS